MLRSILESLGLYLNPILKGWDLVWPKIFKWNVHQSTNLVLISAEAFKIMFYDCLKHLPICWHFTKCRLFFSRRRLEWPPREAIQEKITKRWTFSVLPLGRGGRKRRRENLGIAKIGLTPLPPYPNPGTLVDLTTKARKCDSQHFDVKSA